MKKTYECSFFVSVLRPTKPLSSEEKAFLKRNAKFVRSLNVWLFEGMWETGVDPAKVRDYGEIIVPSLGGMPASELSNLVLGACPALRSEVTG